MNFRIPDVIVEQIFDKWCNLNSADSERHLFHLLKVEDLIHHIQEPVSVFRYKRELFFYRFRGGFALQQVLDRGDDHRQRSANLMRYIGEEPGFDLRFLFLQYDFIAHPVKSIQDTECEIQYQNSQQDVEKIGPPCSPERG